VGTERAPVRLGQEVRLAAGGLALLVGLAAVAQSMSHVVVSLDTTQLVAYADSTLAHLRHGQWQHWGGAYPLLQAIPALALRSQGLRSDYVIDSLIGLNVLSFATMVWVSWRGLVRRSAAGAILLVTVLLSGTLLWYLHASFGEPLAAVVTLAAAVASWHGRRHLAAAMFLFLAGLSKDTAVPFLFVLCVAVSIGAERWTDPAWRWCRLASLLVAASLSLLVTGAYNYARFGSVLALPYLKPVFFVQSPGTEVSFFGAVWLSPNGGLLPFWPSFGVLLILGAIATVRATWSSPSLVAGIRRAAPAVGVVAVLLGVSVELANWWSPLGWVAWGSRLMLPWVPAAAYVLVVAYHEEIERLLRWIVGVPVGFWLAGIALAAASTPQYVAMVRPTLFWEVFIVPDAICPKVPYPGTGAANTYYYTCVNHMLWTKQSMLISAFQAGPNLFFLVIGCACAAGLLWLLQRLRASVRSEIAVDLVTHPSLAEC